MNWSKLLCDLNDLEGLAAWTGAGVTAAAVFLAAFLGESSARRAAKRDRRERLRALAAIYNEVQLVAKSVHVAMASAPGQVDAVDLERFQELSGVLADVAPLELRDYDLVRDLFIVRRALREIETEASEYPTLNVVNDPEGVHAAASASRVYALFGLVQAAIDRIKADTRPNWRRWLARSWHRVRPRRKARA